MSWFASQPYNQLPPLPPTVDLENMRTLKLAVEARAALASLNQAALRLPNSRVLLNALPLLEAQASSEIENIVTTTDELFRYAEDEGAAKDPATREALRYRTALYEGFESVRSRPLNVTTAVDVCSRIKMRDMGIRTLAGTYIGNPLTQAAIYTPPVGEGIIRDKLSNWEQFVHARDGIDPLIKMAAAHYQFEAIHPFEDGNGRTGRVLNVLMLVDAGLLSQPILYLSRYIIQNKNEYYRLLLRVTAERDWDSWVLFILEGIRQTALGTMRKIDAVTSLQSEYHGLVREVIGSANADLLALLFEQPYCRIANVVDRCGVSRPTASGWLNSLSEAGVLVKVHSGRERLFVNARLIDVLTKDQEAAREPEDATLF